MQSDQIDALLLEPGAGMLYFTGIDWYRSERLMVAIIPVQGEATYVCPAFEEERLREMLSIGKQVVTWEEHENPFDLVAGILVKHQVKRLGIEETIRYFVLRNLQSAAPKVEQVSGDPVTIPCRAYKSEHEIELMKTANDITIEAFKYCINDLSEGQSQAEFAENYHWALKQQGVAGSLDVQFGANSAYPHGSRELTYLREGDIVLMDGQCTVDGYWSDITRTIVFGEPTDRQREIWLLEKQAQTAAYAAAQLGVPCETVDAAARQVITDAGFGPGYKVPGLPHRTGHGIGLDIHEWYHIVSGNHVPLAPGMCFSNEPMIAIYGEFGVRLEDCMYMSDAGPHFFSEPSPAIDRPFAPC